MKRSVVKHKALISEYPASAALVCCLSAAGGCSSILIPSSDSAVEDAVAAFDARTTDVAPDSSCDRGADCVGDCANCVAPPFSTSVCVDASCGFQCVAGQADCDGEAMNGCEVNTVTSAAHCGGCGTVCPAQQNAHAACIGGICQSSCLAGFERVQGRCQRIPIQLLYPQSSAVAKDNQPTFRWTASVGVDSYRLEVASTSDFSVVEFSLPTIEPSVRALAPLRGGLTYFWRVVGISGGRDVSRSPSWFFRPTERTVPLREHSFRPVLDLDFEGVGVHSQEIMRLAAA
jgi:hypothetical protein